MNRTPVRHATRILVVLIVISVALAVGFTWHTPASNAQAADAPLDPAAWGEDHVDKKLPQFTEGGECLFCHRTESISKWDRNRHQRTMRLAAPDEPAMQALADAGLDELANEVGLLLGAGEHARYLQKSAKYGQAEMLPVTFTNNDEGGTLAHADSAVWDTVAFAERCAGCHASGIDRETLAYQAVAHDCFVCHGEVPTTHTAKPEEALFAKAGQHGPEVLTAICASCHVRTGIAKSTGRPYPTNFVPGDNVFKDFEIDFSDDAIAALNPIDAHVLMNVRDVVVRGIVGETCMTCHDVHDQNTEAHELLKTRQDCYVCHQEGVRKSDVPPFDVHSAICEY